MKQGVLPTRLSAVDEAASIDILCADKTGTLECAMSLVWQMSNRCPALMTPMCWLSQRWPVRRVGKMPWMAPFAMQPAQQSFGLAATQNLRALRSGNEDVGSDRSRFQRRHAADREAAFAAISGLTEPSTTAAVAADVLETQGFRVLAVAAGSPKSLELVGLIVPSDPPGPIRPASLKS